MRICIIIVRYKENWDGIHNIVTPLQEKVQVFSFSQLQSKIIKQFQFKVNNIALGYFA